MNTDDRRIILQTDFEPALDRVLCGFERAGFCVWPVNGNGRFRVVSDDRVLRCAELEVTLPELTFAADVSATLAGCRITMCELTPDSTLVSANSPLVPYPGLSSLLPRIRLRVDRVLQQLVGSTAQTAA